jgi:hypothetical protein
MRKKWAVGLDPATTTFRFWTQNSAEAFCHKAQDSFGLARTSGNVAPMHTLLWRYDGTSWVPAV